MALLRKALNYKGKRQIPLENCRSNFIKKSRPKFNRRQFHYTIYMKSPVMIKQSLQIKSQGPKENLTKKICRRGRKKKEYEKKTAEKRRQKMGVAQLPRSVKEKQLRCAYGVLDSPC